MIVVACQHWSDNGTTHGGHCAKGLHGGQPSRGLCLTCLANGGATGRKPYRRRKPKLKPRPCDVCGETKIGGCCREGNGCNGCERRRSLLQIRLDTRAAS